MNLKQLISKGLEAAKKSVSKTWKMSWDTMHKTLAYLRIEDEYNRLSLTNIAVIVILYKIAVTDASSITDITALAISIIGYQYKRRVEKKD